MELLKWYKAYLGKGDLNEGPSFYQNGAYFFYIISFQYACMIKVFVQLSI